MLLAIADARIPAKLSAAVGVGDADGVGVGFATTFI